MKLTFVTDLGGTFTVEINPSMELENVLEAEVRTPTDLFAILPPPLSPPTIFGPPRALMHVPVRVRDTRQQHERRLLGNGTMVRSPCTIDKLVLYSLQIASRRSTLVGPTAAHHPGQRAICLFEPRTLPTDALSEILSINTALRVPEAEPATSPLPRYAPPSALSRVNDIRDLFR